VLLTGDSSAAIKSEFDKNQKVRQKRHSHEDQLERTAKVQEENLLVAKADAHDRKVKDAKVAGDALELTRKESDLLDEAEAQLKH